MQSNPRLKRGLRCTSACVTRDHRTWGECMRAKSLQVKPNLSNTGASRRHERELDAYRSARSQGIQPAGTTMDKIESAVRISEQTGVAYQADKPMFDVSVS